jgi:regulator of sigma E protease
VPAVVGGVVPNSPAALAGLAAGDEVVEIDGESGNLEFSNILVAAALSGKDEEVGLKVRHADGSIEDFSMAASRMPGTQMRVFGILQPQSLVIEDVSDANALFEKIGLLPGDCIKAVNGKDVQTYWELAEIIGDCLSPTAVILAERAEGASKGRLVESQVELSWDCAENYEVESESELYHICSMVPRLRIVYAEAPAVKNRFVSWLGKIGTGRGGVGAEGRLQSGDIILAVGDVENPTYKELREVTEAYEGKGLSVRVLRKDADGIERPYTVIVVPERPSGVDRVMIGIGVALDAEHPVVAKTIAAEGGPEPLAIPRGAVITAVDGVEVSSFYDIAGRISQCAGRRIMINYRLDDQTAGGVSLNVDSEKELVAVRSKVLVPFKPLQRLYKATGPVGAVVMGYEKTIMYIAQTYATLKTLIEGQVSPKQLMGPVGILTLSYRVVSEQPLVYYVYLLGLISACIAVFNFLPLPPLDGGLVVLLLVEKIKGSALSERTQEIIAYAGWVLIGSLALYVTFNDIVRSFFS